MPLARRGHTAQEGPVRPAAGGAARPSPQFVWKACGPRSKGGAGGERKAGPAEAGAGQVLRISQNILPDFRC